MSNRGYQVLKNFIASSILEALQQEAINQLQYAVRNEGKAELPLPERGGQPSRRLYSSQGEKVLQNLYCNANILRQLEKCTGLRLIPSGEQGSYSYYLHRGDYLSLHRDIHSCDVTFITTLYDQSSHNNKGGMLCLYPERRLEPLNHILKTPLQGATLLRLQQGDSLILLGGVIPHWVLPIQKNEIRVAALLCYCAS
jgi:hypothetical protein